MENIENQQKDLYSVLCLQRNASDKDIAKAYKQVLESLHQNLRSEFNDNENNQDESSPDSRLSEVQFAYSILGDPEKRAAYDSKLEPLVDSNLNEQVADLMKNRNARQNNTEIFKINRKEFDGDLYWRGGFGSSSEGIGEERPKDFIDKICDVLDLERTGSWTVKPKVDMSPNVFYASIIASLLGGAGCILAIRYVLENM